MDTIVGTPPDLSFPTVVRAVLRDARARFGLDQVHLVVTRGEDWQVLLAEGGGVGLAEGTLLPDEMATGVPPGVQTFVSTLVLRPDGSLFGALCGLARESLPVTGADQALAMYALSITLLQAQEAHAALSAAVSGPAPIDARRDELTGLPNARGFEEAMVREAERSRRYGNRASLVAVRVLGLVGTESPGPGGPGEVIVRQAADALRSWRRGADVVARTGEADFAALLVESWRDDAEAALDRLAKTFESRRIDYVAGIADNQGQSLAEALEQAHAQLTQP